MKKSLILFVLAALINASPAFAQVMDMRAVSLRRGFKAYQIKPMREQSVPQQNPVDPDRVRSQEKETAASEKKDRFKATEATDQTDEIQQYIAENPQVKPDI